jgi:hypothetical protein
MYIVILTTGKMRVHALAFTCEEPLKASGAVMVVIYGS